MVPDGEVGVWIEGRSWIRTQSVDESSSCFDFWVGRAGICKHECDLRFARISYGVEMKKKRGLGRCVTSVVDSYERNGELMIEKRGVKERLSRLLGCNPNTTTILSKCRIRIDLLAGMYNHQHRHRHRHYFFPPPDLALKLPSKPGLLTLAFFPAPPFLLVPPFFPPPPFSSLLFAILSCLFLCLAS
jgi:hypothetical protein